MLLVSQLHIGLVSFPRSTITVDDGSGLDDNDGLPPPILPSDIVHYMWPIDGGPLGTDTMSYAASAMVGKACILLLVA